MIAEKEVTGTIPVEMVTTPVEERPAIPVSETQPKWNAKFFVASDICLLAGLLLIVIAILLPASITPGLALLVLEVSLFVVGAELFALGFIWPRIK